jgi:hypothetical protein
MEETTMKGYKGLVQWFKGTELVGEREFNNKEEMRNFACALVNYNVKIEETCQL